MSEEKKAPQPTGGADVPQETTETPATQPAAPATENGNGDDDDSFTKASPAQKGALATLLIIITIVLAILAGAMLRKVERQLHVEDYVGWELPDDMLLLHGPVSFWYDHERKRLVHRGPIDDATKKVLVELAGPATPADGENAATPSSESLQSYQAAIDKLAYQSNSRLDSLIVSLLILGGLGGAVGVQIRSLTNFVGIASFKNKLDVKRWWPWYFLRPFTGFLLGALLYVLVSAQLFDLQSNIANDSLWWLGVTVLVGFGASDFTDRLRSLTQTLFGKSS